MRTKRIVLWAVVVVVLAMLSVNSGVCNKEKPVRDELYQQMEVVAEVIDLVRSDYVEEVDSQTIIYGALKGMLASLGDAHTQFMDPDMYEMMKADTVGEFGGLGIEISIRDNLLTVISPLDGTPAKVAGIKAGDRIVKIDGEITRDITLLEAVKKLRGEPGSQVTVTIMREEEEKLLEKTVTRAIVKIEAVPEAKIVEDKIGYIRLASFQSNAPRELEKSLKSLKDQGAESFIFDLRNNTGGALDVAIKVAQKFLPRDELIVTTKGRRKDQNVEYRSRARNGYFAEPLVVLVNHGSASAAEILAGAIQDQARGIILGTKTFGKGSVQMLLPLRDGSGLRLTTGKWFTPGGSLIQDQGITPDIIVAYQEVPVKEKTLAERVFEQVEEEKEIPEAETEEEEIYDSQMSRAIDLLKGLKVYEKFRAKSG